jgi:hypothetical protein
LLLATGEAFAGAGQGFGAGGANRLPGAQGNADQQGEAD